MSYTSTLQNCSLFLVITITTLLLVSFSPSEVSRAINHPLNVELENEVSLVPDEQNTFSDQDSELTLSYETELLKVETSSEFDLEGLSEGEFLLGIGKDSIETECKLIFDPQESQLESYELTGDIQLDSKTSLDLEYESDYPAEGETTDPEIVLTLDRELTKSLSIRVEGEFSETERELGPVPAETEVDISGLSGKNFNLDAELEFEETEPEEIEFDFEGTDSFFHNSGLILESSLSWDLSENFVEFEPEFELEFGDLSLETILYLRDEARISKLKLVEVSLDDLEFAEWDLELSNDFETGESEIALEKNHEKLDVEFEFEIQAEATNNPFNLGQRAGELTWYPEEFWSASIEIESGPSSPPEFTFASEYEF